MKIVLYGRQLVKPTSSLLGLSSEEARNTDTLQLFAAGCICHGCSIDWIDLKSFPSGRKEVCDAVVVNGSYPRHSEVLASHECCRFILDDSYWPVNRSYRTIFVTDRYKFMEQECPPDRAEEIGLIAESVPRKQENYILLAGSVYPPKGFENVEAWAVHQIRKIREYTSKPIVWKPHPGTADLYQLSCHHVQVIHNTAMEAVTHARAVVTHSSGIAFEAMIAGVPVFCDKEAPYASCCQSDYSGLTDSIQINKTIVQDFLNRVAYTQWSPDEIRSGLTINLLAGMGVFNGTSCKYI